ncbi:LOW QUALITY PROTEIN: uncharacterized protein LOC121377181 [Gigantopelta aegis]|uniref:LOW QUALITY PROTEIN: uncharacterized protein LOC121377181 n=1 Tax=Gigantopelta aegis TaxID=1735272 RepID=UPI001B88E1C6|nr:LOW QUALITY PROTEIN: uncharacterized protein LOC121377181 [Gigantopelta aegis]
MLFTRRDDEVDCLIERISDTDSVEKADKLYSCVCYPRIKKRHVLTIWAFLGFFNVYCLRVNLSVALVAMVNNTDSSTNDTQNTECVGPNDTTTKNLSGEFPWNEETQGWVLGAFFYGCIITQIPGGSSYLAATISGEFPWNEETQGWVLGTFFYGCIITQIPGGSSYLAATISGEFPWNEETQGWVLGAFFYGCIITQIPGGSSYLAATISGEFPWNEETQGWVLGTFFYGYIITQIPGGSTYLAATFSGEFPWNEETQGWVLGAFFYGYIITQIPGGSTYLAATFSGEFPWNEETQGWVLGAFFYGCIITQIPGGSSYLAATIESSPGTRRLKAGFLVPSSTVTSLHRSRVARAIWRPHLLSYNACICFSQESSPGTRRLKAGFLAPSSTVTSLHRSRVARAIWQPHLLSYNALYLFQSGEFPWNEETQGWVLGAFFYGYIITQIPGGYLAATFGAKRLFAYGILCTSVLTLLTPVAARLHLGVLIALRVVEGLGEGVTFPSMHAMWGNWAPVWERSKLTGFAYAGAQLGTVFAMPISAILCSSSFLGGWPSCFSMSIQQITDAVWFLYRSLKLVASPTYDSVFDFVVTVACLWRNVVLLARGIFLVEYSKSFTCKFILNSAQLVYKKTSHSTTNMITPTDKEIAKKLELDDRIEVSANRDSFITLKDHKPDFNNNPTCRLINPSKSEIGIISKHILDKINIQIIKATKVNLWRNTSSAIEWFKNIPEKRKHAFITFDVCNFYPSISEDLLRKALDYASTFTDITQQDQEIIIHTKRSLLYHKDSPWIKKDTNNMFDVPMGSYDGAETCELIGTYMLSLIASKFKDEIGLYRDDGGLGVLWFVFWMWIIHETPADHPTITKAEQQYIEESIGQKEHMSTPWKEILTCPALWGIAAAHVSNNWLLYMTLTCLPTYMKYILKFDMKSNGFLSALPYLVLWFMQVFSSWFADFLRKNLYLSTLSTRKILNTAGLLLPTVFIVGAGYTGCDHTLAVVLLTLAVGSAGMTMPGFNVNHLDIAPKFAGVLLGITNSLATIPGFLAPIVVGVLTNHNETSEQWRIIFFMTAGILVTGAVIFAVLAQGDEMLWARENAELGKWTQKTPEPSDIQGADYSPVHGKEQ